MREFHPIGDPVRDSLIGEIIGRIVKRGGVAVTQKDVGAWHLPQDKREILRTHHRFQRVVHPAGTSHRAHRGQGYFGFVVMIDRQLVAGF
jgi:hypothetical protein